MALKLHEYAKSPAWGWTGSLGEFPSNTCVGVEIELENMPELKWDTRHNCITTPPAGWVIHHDGSLRNNGAEFVFINPTGGTDITDRLSALREFLKNYKPDPSERTSVHVHVDASGCTTSELLKWITIYTVYEKILFNVFAPKRITSHFCIPICDSHESIMMAQDLKSDSWTKFYTTSSRRGEQRRYSAVNLDSIRKFNSLEFRHLGGTLDYSLISDWINVLLRLKVWGMNPDNGFEAFFYGPSKLHAEGATRSIFGWRLANVLMSHPNFNQLYLEGVRTAQLLYIENDIPPIPSVVKDKLEEKRKQRKLKKLNGLIDVIDKVKGLKFKRGYDDYNDYLDRVLGDGDEGDEAPAEPVRPRRRDGAFTTRAFRTTAWAHVDNIGDTFETRPFPELAAQGDVRIADYPTNVRFFDIAPNQTLVFPDGNTVLNTSAFHMRYDKDRNVFNAI